MSTSGPQTRKGEKNVPVISDLTRSARDRACAAAEHGQRPLYAGGQTQYADSVCGSHASCDRTPSDARNSGATGAESTLLSYCGVLNAFTVNL